MSWGWARHGRQGNRVARPFKTVRHIFLEKRSVKSPRFSESSIIISRVLKRLQGMTLVEKLGIMVRAGLVTKEEAEAAEQRLKEENSDQ